MAAEYSNSSSLKLFSELRKSECIFSPASINFALSIVHQAACGGTDSQLTDFFGGKFSIENLVSLVESLKDTGMMKISNSCVVSDKLSGEINNDLLDSIRSFAKVFLEDFDHPEPIQKKLNALISDETNGLIKGTVSGLDKRSLLVIVNTVYFKAKWKYKFEPEKTDNSANFYSAVDRSIKHIKMMTMKEVKRIPYFENEAVQMVELQYLKPSSTANSDFVMGIVLPKDRNNRYLPDAELQQYIEQLTTEDNVEVKIPKFTLRKRVELIPVLRTLGVTDLFSKTICDLSKLFGNSNAYVSDVIHEAVIIVDEVGTEAAAATVVKVAMKRKFGEKEHKVFVADHSFVFYIRHVPTSSFVFMGEYHGV